MHVVKLPANQPPDRFYRGGDRISEFRGEPRVAGRTPEDWLASTTPLFGESELGLSRMPDGRLLQAHIEEDPIGWLGAEHVRSTGADPALLVKLLDAGERLPVHLHPNRPFSTKHLDSCYGKNEAWVALTACEVYLGFGENVAADQLEQWVRSQDVEALLGVMNKVSLASGDAVFVPAGMPHAIGPGAFVVELQEPTDFSILLEWRGYAIDGEQKGRVGLDWGTALEATDLSAWDEARLATLRAADATTTGNLLPPASKDFFIAERHTISGEQVLEPGYSIMVVTAGSGNLVDQSGLKTHVKRGDTLLSPESAGSLELEGHLELLRCRPPRLR